MGTLTTRILAVRRSIRTKRKIQSPSVRRNVLVRPGDNEEVRVGINNSGGSLGRRLRSGAFMRLRR